MTTLNVPAISRKKRGPFSYDAADSFHKVLGHAAAGKKFQRPVDVPESSIMFYDKTLNLPSWFYNSHYEPERNIRARDNCKVTYLRRNVKTLNAPVCYVPSEQEGEHWWPSGVPKQDKPQPSRTKDTTMRSDYNWNCTHAGYTGNRHKYNTEERALGVAPINWLEERDGTQRFHKEKISYEHQYDSRWDKNYPLRSRRHGAFVNEKITQDTAENLLENEAKWRTDTYIRVPDVNSTGGTSLPHIGEARTAQHPNTRKRQNFDIAPRSNLNVRIREYIPTVICSAPPTHHTREDKSEPQASPPPHQEVSVQPPAVALPPAPVV